MKHYITALILLLTLFTLNAAEPVYRYEGEVTGVVCRVCSGKVKNALQQLPGVKSVKLKSGKSPGTAVIQLESVSADLGLQTAIKSLGKDTASYTITRFALVKP